MTQQGRVAYGIQTSCQSCHSSELETALSLGYLPPVNTMVPVGHPLPSQQWFPAPMVRCASCTLVQLGYAVEPELLFPPDYPYTSGSTRILRENFAQLREEASELVGLGSDALVVDVGSNDGTLLSNFKDAGLRVLGVEPTLTGRLAEAQGIPTIEAFFDAAVGERIVAEQGKASLVTAANVFAHILDVHGVLDGITTLIGEEGVFVSESHYLLTLLETLQYDTIYHEHLRYYSVHSLRRLLAIHDLEIFAVRQIPTHGGSIRVYASKAGVRPVEDSVQRFEDREGTAGLLDGSWIEPFRKRVLHSKLKLYELLGSLGDNAEMYGVGAPSRASTLINHVGLDDSMLRCVVEISTSKKLDRYIPGTRIPVLDEKILYEEQPGYALLLSWHIGDELSRALKKRGYTGDFISPLPEPRIIESSKVPV